MDIVLIRHTPVQAAPGLCYGVTDLPLAATASRDIEEVLRDLRAVDDVVSSPATRCRRLAEAIAARDQCGLRIAPALRELDFGAWEGLPWDAIDRRESDPWAEDPWNRAPPGGESESALWRRLQGWLADSTPPPQGRVASVAHGGPLRLLRCHFEGRRLEDRWSASLALGSVVELQWPDGVPWAVHDTPGSLVSSDFWR